MCVCLPSDLRHDCRQSVRFCTGMQPVMSEIINLTALYVYGNLALNNNDEFIYSATVVLACEVWR